MKAYACVYRRCRATGREIEQTRIAATADPLLARFLEEYSEAACYWDWGDDPSFFSALHRLGDVRAASWGVCRRDVRAALAVGDFVAFFCGQQVEHTLGRWEYFYVGVGTVGSLHTRQEIWTREELGPYRGFYNILARWSGGMLSQHETFFPRHPNWVQRAASPYILFDTALSDFNVTSPLHVASYAGEVPETWKLESLIVRRLHKLLFSGRTDRKGLRTSKTGYGHAKLNLLGPRESRGRRLPLNALRTELLKLVKATA